MSVAAWQGLPPPAWNGQPLHVVADTGFAEGLNFLCAWRAWRDDPNRPDRLHWAATTPQAPAVAALLQSAGTQPGLTELAAELCGQWPAPAPPGHHVLTLDGGRVTLTLCVGELLPVLHGWRFLADTVLLGPDGDSPEVLRALARLSHRQTRLVAAQASGALADALAGAGFAVTTAHSPLTARYAPRWPAPDAPQRAPGHATVLGAGLAGAALCRALGRRGWTLTLLDQADGPAQGASSLPAGLLAPHPTAQPTALSRLTEVGARWMRRELPRVLPQGQGAGWQAGLLRVDGTQPPQTLPDALQVTPAALVQAWLDEAHGTGRLTPVWRSRVTHLERQAGHWVVHGPGGAALETATLVLASAWGSQALLAPWGGDALALSPVRGQLSLGLATDLTDAPAQAIHGAGVFVPRCHWQGQDHWATGATYERGDSATDVRQANHRANLAALQGWLPDLAAQLAPCFERQQVAGWAQVRCATGDRLPLAGALPDVAALQARHPVHRQPRLDGLHTLTGLGSRGLTLSLLCAEVLAARLTAEPLPVPAELADALDPARFALRNQRRTG